MIHENYPTIKADQIHLLSELSEAIAVSGDESEVRSIVLKHIRPHVTDIRIDPLGNILAKRPGKGAKRIKVMLAAHMDEVGMMLTYLDDKEDGNFRFETVGGLAENQLLGKPVWIGKNHVPGVIGTKPIHLYTDKELESPIPVDTLRIDVGPENSNLVEPGDRATFATQFKRMGKSLCGKALDDRLGVVTLIEILKHPIDNIDLLAAFTVQEEVGLRGARVAAYSLEPQIAIALDCTPAQDMPIFEKEGFPGEENTFYNTRLDAGPAIYLMDGATISDPRLVNHFTQVAKNNEIPYQFRQPGMGGTDAGAIHKQRDGIPSLSISVPCRYLHTAASIVRLNDWQYLIRLLFIGLQGLNEKVITTKD